MPYGTVNVPVRTRRPVPVVWCLLRPMLANAGMKHAALVIDGYRVWPEKALSSTGLSEPRADYEAEFEVDAWLALRTLRTAGMLCRRAAGVVCRLDASFWCRGISSLPR